MENLEKNKIKKTKKEIKKSPVLEMIQKIKSIESLKITEQKKEIKEDLLQLVDHFEQNEDITKGPDHLIEWIDEYAELSREKQNLIKEIAKEKNYLVLNDMIIHQIQEKILKQIKNKTFPLPASRKNADLEQTLGEKARTYKELTIKDYSSEKTDEILDELVGRELPQIIGNELADQAYREISSAEAPEIPEKQKIEILLNCDQKTRKPKDPSEENLFEYDTQLDLPEKDEKGTSEFITSEGIIELTQKEFNVLRNVFTFFSIKTLTEYENVSPFVKGKLIFIMNILNRPTNKDTNFEFALLNLKILWNSRQFGDFLDQIANFEDSVTGEEEVYRRLLKVNMILTFDNNRHNFINREETLNRYLSLVTSKQKPERTHIERHWSIHQTE